MSGSGPPPETRGDTALVEVGTSLDSIIIDLYNYMQCIYVGLRNVRYH